MRSGARVARAAAGACLLSVVAWTACARTEEPAPSAPDHASTPHSDHTPRFGGLVLMDGNLHFEVTARPSGEYRVYFSDERRNPLPTSAVTDAVITVMRPDGDAETVALQPDAENQSWEGKSRPVESGETTIRVSYSHDGEPYWIDLPFIGFQAAGAAAAPTGR